MRGLDPGLRWSENLPAWLDDGTERGTPAIVGACLVHASVGLVFTLPHIMPYVASYLLINDHDHYPLGDGGVETACYGCFTISLLIGATLETHVHSMATCLCGGFIMCAGAVASAAMPSGFATAWLVVFLGDPLSLQTATCCVDYASCSTTNLPGW